MFTEFDPDTRLLLFRQHEAELHAEARLRRLARRPSRGSPWRRWRTWLRRVVAGRRSRTASRATALR